jgi:uncharacterized protein HemX
MKSSKKTESAFDKDPQVEAVQEESTKDKVVKKSIARKTVLMWTVVVLLVIAGAGSGVYYYIQYQTSQKILKDPVLGTRIEAEKTVEKVAKMVELPQEQPTIATVSDVSKMVIRCSSTRTPKKQYCTAPERIRSLSSDRSIWGLRMQPHPPM